MREVELVQDKHLWLKRLAYTFFSFLENDIV